MTENAQNQSPSRKIRQVAVHGSRSALGRAALAVLALGALAACETAPAESPAATEPAAAQGAAAGAPEQRISMADCASPPEGRVYFSLGESVLAVPADDVREVYPTGLQAPVSEEAVTAAIRSRAADGAGCPEKPMEAVLVAVGGGTTDPLLEGTIGILRAPPEAITDQFAKITRDLQRNPTQNCRPVNGGLLTCVGTETAGQRETPVMYVITTDTSRNLNTGGPLAARCVLAGAQQPAPGQPAAGIRNCNIVDEVPGGLIVDATLKAGTFSTETLAQAHRAALARVQSLRL
jgi:hypothetical protein